MEFPFPSNFNVNCDNVKRCEPEFQIRDKLSNAISNPELLF